MQSICEALIEELRRRPDLARALAEVLAPYLPELLTVLREILESIRALREDFNRMLARLEALERRHAEDVQRILRRLEALEKRHAEDTQKILRRIEALERRHAEDTQMLLRRLEALEKRHAEDMQRVSRTLEEHARILREHSRVLEEHSKILREHSATLRYLLKMTAEIRHVLGRSFEKFARKMLEDRLKAMGLLPKSAKLTSKVLPDGTEVNVFCERPLVIGEVTSLATDASDIKKLIERVKAVERALGKKSELRVLMIATVIGRELFERIKRLAEEHGIVLIVGEVLE